VEAVNGATVFMTIGGEATGVGVAKLAHPEMKKATLIKDEINIFIIQPSIKEHQKIKKGTVLRLSQGVKYFDLRHRQNNDD